MCGDGGGGSTLGAVCLNPCILGAHGETTACSHSAPAPQSILYLPLLCAEEEREGREKGEGKVDTSVQTSELGPGRLAREGCRRSRAGSSPKRVLKELGVLGPPSRRAVPGHTLQLWGTGLGSLRVLRGSQLDPDSGSGLQLWGGLFGPLASLRPKMRVGGILVCLSGGGGVLPQPSLCAGMGGH